MVWGAAATFAHQQWQVSAQHAAQYSDKRLQAMAFMHWRQYISSSRHSSLMKKVVPQWHQRRQQLLALRAWTEVVAVEQQHRQVMVAAAEEKHRQHLLQLAFSAWQVQLGRSKQLQQLQAGLGQRLVSSVFSAWQQVVLKGKVEEALVEALTEQCSRGQQLAGVLCAWHSWVYGRRRWQEQQLQRYQHRHMLQVLKAWQGMAAERRAQNPLLQGEVEVGLAAVGGGKSKGEPSSWEVSGFESLLLRQSSDAAGKQGVREGGLQEGEGLADSAGASLASVFYSSASPSRRGSCSWSAGEDGSAPERTSNSAAAAAAVPEAGCFTALKDSSEAKEELVKALQRLPGARATSSSFQTAGPEAVEMFAPDRQHGANPAASVLSVVPCSSAAGGAPASAAAAGKSLWNLPATAAATAAGQSLSSSKPVQILTGKRTSAAEAAAVAGAIAGPLPPSTAGAYPRCALHPRLPAAVCEERLSGACNSPQHEQGVHSHSNKQQEVTSSPGFLSSTSKPFAAKGRVWSTDGGILTSAVGRPFSCSPRSPAYFSAARGLCLGAGSVELHGGKLQDSAAGAEFFGPKTAATALEVLASSEQLPAHSASCRGANKVQPQLGREGEALVAAAVIPQQLVASSTEPRCVVRSLTFECHQQKQQWQQQQQHDPAVVLAVERMASPARAVRSPSVTPLTIGSVWGACPVAVPTYSSPPCTALGKVQKVRSEGGAPATAAMAAAAAFVDGRGHKQIAAAPCSRDFVPAAERLCSPARRRLYASSPGTAPAMEPPLLSCFGLFPAESTAASSKAAKQQPTAADAAPSCPATNSNVAPPAPAEPRAAAAVPAAATAATDWEAVAADGTGPAARGKTTFTAGAAAAAHVVTSPCKQLSLRCGPWAVGVAAEVGTLCKVWPIAWSLPGSLAQGGERRVLRTDAATGAVTAPSAGIASDQGSLIDASLVSESSSSMLGTAAEVLGGAANRSSTAARALSQLRRLRADTADFVPVSPDYDSARVSCAATQAAAAYKNNWTREQDVSEGQAGAEAAVAAGRASGGRLGPVEANEVALPAGLGSKSVVGQVGGPSAVGWRDEVRHEPAGGAPTTGSQEGASGTAAIAGSAVGNQLAANTQKPSAALQAAGMAHGHDVAVRDTSPRPLVVESGTTSSSKGMDNGDQHSKPLPQLQQQTHREQEQVENTVQPGEETVLHERLQKVEQWQQQLAALLQEQMLWLQEQQPAGDSPSIVPANAQVQPSLPLVQQQESSQSLVKEQQHGRTYPLLPCQQQGQDQQQQQQQQSEEHQEQLQRKILKQQQQQEDQKLQQEQWKEQQEQLQSQQQNHQQEDQALQQQPLQEQQEQLQRKGHQEQQQQKKLQQLHSHQQLQQPMEQQEQLQQKQRVQQQEDQKLQQHVKEQQQPMKQHEQLQWKQQEQQQEEQQRLEEHQEQLPKEPHKQQHSVEWQQQSMEHQEQLQPKQQEQKQEEQKQKEQHLEEEQEQANEQQEQLEQKQQQEEKQQQQQEQHQQQQEDEHLQTRSCQQQQDLQQQQSQQSLQEQEVLPWLLEVLQEQEQHQNQKQQWQYSCTPFALQQQREGLTRSQKQQVYTESSAYHTQELLPHFKQPDHLKQQQQIQEYKQRKVHVGPMCSVNQAASGDFAAKVMVEEMWDERSVPLFSPKGASGGEVCTVRCGQPAASLAPSAAVIHPFFEAPAWTSTAADADSSVPLAADTAAAVALDGAAGDAAVAGNTVQAPERRGWRLQTVLPKLGCEGPSSESSWSSSSSTGAHNGHRQPAVVEWDSLPARLAVSGTATSMAGVTHSALSEVKSQPSTISPAIRSEARVADVAGAPAAATPLAADTKAVREGWVEVTLHPERQSARLRQQLPAASPGGILQPASGQPGRETDDDVVHKLPLDQLLGLAEEQLVELAFQAGRAAGAAGGPAISSGSSRGGSRRAGGSDSSPGAVAGHGASARQVSMKRCVPGADGSRVKDKQGAGLATAAAAIGSWGGAHSGGVRRGEGLAAASLGGTKSEPGDGTQEPGNAVTHTSPQQNKVAVARGSEKGKGRVSSPGGGRLRQVGDGTEIRRATASPGKTNWGAGEPRLQKRGALAVSAQLSQCQQQQQWQRHQKQQQQSWRQPSPGMVRGPAARVSSLMKNQEASSVCGAGGNRSGAAEEFGGDRAARLGRLASEKHQGRTLTAAELALFAQTLQRQQKTTPSSTYRGQLMRTAPTGGAAKAAHHSSSRITALASTLSPGPTGGGALSAGREVIPSCNVTDSCKKGLWLGAGGGDGPLRPGLLVSQRVPAELAGSSSPVHVVHEVTVVPGAQASLDGGGILQAGGLGVRGAYAEREQEGDHQTDTLEDGNLQEGYERLLLECARLEQQVLKLQQQQQ